MANDEHHEHTMKRLRLLGGSVVGLFALFALWNTFDLALAVRVWSAHRANDLQSMRFFVDYFEFTLLTVRPRLVMNALVLSLFAAWCRVVFRHTEVVWSAAGRGSRIMLGMWCACFASSFIPVETLVRTTGLRWALEWVLEMRVLESSLDLLASALTAGVVVLVTRAQLHAKRMDDDSVVEAMA